MPLHRHIVLRNLGETLESFEAYPGRGGRRPSAIPDRPAHAKSLRDGLNKVHRSIAQVVGSQVASGVLPAQTGTALTVRSRPGEPLDVGTGRANSRNLAVLNVRRWRDRSEGGRTRTQATIFASEKGVNELLDLVRQYAVFKDVDDEYAEDEPSKSERPKRFWLFEGAETFAPASIYDFWTDPGRLPAKLVEHEWEVWVRTSMAKPFAAAVQRLKIRDVGWPTLCFSDIEVHNLIADRAAMEDLIEASGAVMELRGASNFEAEPDSGSAKASVRRATDLAARLMPAPPTAPLVTLLDTGVNRNNPLLGASLPATRCLSVLPAWNRFDADGHGTKMAGVSLLGDLDEHLAGSGSIQIEHALESVAVFSPGHPDRLPARDAIQRAVASLGATPADRIFCLAATAVGEAEDGRPTTTSAMLDRLAFGDGLDTRLFCVAVGNVHADASSPYRTSDYATLNENHGVQSPAQALNVLSIGAATRKCSGPDPLADHGDLSPRSRTAQGWDVAHPHKPDILMEGGNHGIDPGGRTSRPHGPDMVSTTSRNISRPITSTGDTSAATAAAARLAARIKSRYPALRPETLRALMVHSAEWTDAMVARQGVLTRNGMDEREAWASILDCYGWGIPDERRAFWSADNVLTLIVEDELHPYKRLPGKSITLGEMKFFRLPWPDAALKALRTTEVELRVTLSYFAEPDLHSSGVDRMQFYPSHRLRYDFQRQEETEERAQRRLNKAIPKSGEPAGDDSGWLLGQDLRVRGTLHQDVWTGPAYKLVDRKGISVAPVRGWWSARPAMSPEDRSVRFSLVVSIRTPSVRNDLVLDAMTRVRAGTLLDVPALVHV